MIKYKLLIDCKSPGAEKWFEVINDKVMGGLSESRVTITPDNTALFEGELSLENKGGFASIRTYIGDLRGSSSAGIPPLRRNVLPKRQNCRIFSICLITKKGPSVARQDS